MKKLLLPLILLVAIIAVAASCKKSTTTNTVTIVKNDTTTLTNYDSVYAPSLIGTWQPATDTTALAPTFTKDSVKWGYTPAYAYVASGDTIFFKGTNEVITPEYYYTISGGDDTLYIKELMVTGQPTIVYWRNP